jgi:hypothetical protein
MNSTTSNTELFAALKPEDSTSPRAINEATLAAEQRWPLLKSISPQKWEIAAALSGEEKSKRARLEPIEAVTRRSPASTPNISAQLANALNRMVSVKPNLQVPLLKKAPMQEITPAPISIPPLTPVAAPHSPKAGADSITSVLHRIEQANSPVSITVEKVPGFLSRLGKR